MSHRALLVQTYIAGAALFGSALVYSAAYAQSPGCCEGGSAYGANAWTAGNNWAGWGGAAAPIFSPSDSWPADAESQAGLKDDGPAPTWWTHGDLEIGGRGFTNDPTVGGQVTRDTGGFTASAPTSTTKSGVTTTTTTYNATTQTVNQQSLAKYYEYSTVSPGAFGGGHFAMGSSDGLYQLDLWANNVGSNFAGFSDQAYTLQVSKAGEQYLTVTWDETPHIYSTSAQTPFQGVGTAHLTWPGAALSGGGSGTYTGTSVTTTPPGTTTAYNNFPADYNNLHPIDLGIQRDTISFAYRWTPEFGEGGAKDGGAFSQYDFNANYSYMTRTGTQAAGVVELNGFNPTQVPAPVDDSTQNFGVSGERSGETPWGKYTFKLGYAGSVYTDNISSFTVANPFFPSATCPAGTTNCAAAQLSTPPSNDMNSISATATADLPYHTRYAGTLSYTDMSQNQTFLDVTNNGTGAGGFAIPSTSPYYTVGNTGWNQINYGFINRNLSQPINSLNGDIQTILSNNVLTTQITPELTSKLSYRYYNFDNGTPNIAFPCWTSYDGPGTTTGCGGSESAIQNLVINYAKQDLGAELNWRPDREWNFTAAYGFERYDYQDVDVSATNENSAKLSADWRPVSWFDARLSGSFADRTAEDYNYQALVAENQFGNTTTGNMTFTCATGSPGCVGGTYTAAAQTSFEYTTAYRQFMFDDREQTKAQFQTNITVLPNVTVSPSIKYQDDNYSINPNYNVGVADNSMLSWGVDTVYVPHPDLSLSLSYYQEFYNTLDYAMTCQPNGAHGACTTGASVGPNGIPTPATLVTTTDKEFVNTITAAASYVIIPKTLTLDLRASVSDGVDSQSLTNCTSGCPLPNNNTLFEHVEANLIYKLDPALLGDAGFKDMKLKLRYTWERNAVTNWQNDSIAPVTSSIGNGALFMDYDNPNYNVQMVSASIIVKW